MNFTVGMAMYTQPGDDMEPARLRFTVQGLLQHPEVAEILVVDNNPYDPSPIKDFCEKCPRTRYLPFAGVRGTAAPRNHIFRCATKSHVVVIDPHVILYPGCLRAVAEFYGARSPRCGDLVHGPMMNEGGTVHSTHMNDQWRAGMWGTWGRAWRTPDKNLIFSCIHEDGENTAYYVIVNPEPDLRPRLLTVDEVAKYKLPDDLPYQGHEDVLTALGCHEPPGPFPIPDHGMGFFASPRDKWLPFHEHASGFGGEEMTTGVRYRRDGRTVWCVPGAKWWHDFGRPFHNPPYPMFAYHRIRNYVLEFQRNKMDPDEIRQHFFVKQGMNGRPSDWDAALAGQNWPAGVGANGLPLPRDIKATPKRACPPMIREERKSICLNCPRVKISAGDANDPKTPPDLCGVTNKPVMDYVRWANQSCPDTPPRWGEVAASQKDFPQEEVAADAR